MGFGSGYSHTTSHYSDARTVDTGTRARKTFDNRGVAHAWAHMGQTFGQSGNGHFYFEGRTLYSYGSHFAVGVRILPEDGDRHGGFALLNSDSYSISTGGHQSDARSATHHLTTYSVPALQEIADRLPSRVGEAVDEYNARRVAEYVENVIQRIDADAASFLLRLIGRKSDGATVARMKAKADKAAEAAKVRKAKETARREVETAKRIIAQVDDVHAFGDVLDKWARETKRTGNPYPFDNWLKEARRAHKAASKAGFSRIKAGVWSAIRKVSLSMSEALNAHKAASRNEYTRRQCAVIRDYAKRHAGTGAPLTGYDYQQFAAALDFVATHAPGTSRAMPALLVAIDQARALHRSVMAQEAEASRIKREREAAEKFAKQAEARAEWLAGKPGRAPYGMADEKGRALVRAVRVTRDDAGEIAGGTLETSQGASVPLLEAIKVFRMVKLCRDRGQGWKRNGARLPVGGFQVDSIDKSGAFVAGCHSFSWEEIARLAASLGLSDIAPADTTAHA